MKSSDDSPPEFFLLSPMTPTTDEAADRAYIAEMDARLGQRVSAARERAGWTQRDLSALMSLVFRINWHQTTCGKVESGERPTKTSEAAALAFLLGLPLTELLGREVVTDDAARVGFAMKELDELQNIIGRRMRQLRDSLGEVDNG